MGRQATLVTPILLISQYTISGDKRNRSHLLGGTSIPRFQHKFRNGHVVEVN